LDQSNASAIEEAMEPFTRGKNPDVVPEHHTHWLCGWAEGHSIRVFKRGRITKAFRAYHALAVRLADYRLRGLVSVTWEAVMEEIAEARCNSDI